MRTINLDPWSLFSSPSYGLFSRRRGVIMAPNYRRRLYFFWYKKSDVYMQCRGQFLTVIGAIKACRTYICIRLRSPVLSLSVAVTLLAAPTIHFYNRRRKSITTALCIRPGGLRLRPFTVHWAVVDVAVKIHNRRRMQMYVRQALVLLKNVKDQINKW